MLWRGSYTYIAITTFLILLTGLIVSDTSTRKVKAAHALRERSVMVSSFRLTDLCLSTEARYTRHISMADRFAPFQEHPSSFEHFPSGSFFIPLPKE